MGTGSKSQNSIRGWIALLFLCAVLLALVVAVKAQSVIGVAATLAIFAAVFWFFARRGRKYYDAHPQEAAEAARKREILVRESQLRSNRNFKAHVIGIVVAIGIVLLARAGRNFMPAFAALSRKEQLIWLFLGAVVAVVTINVVIAIVKKRRAPSAQP